MDPPYSLPAPSICAFAVTNVIVIQHHNSSSQQHGTSITLADTALHVRTPCLRQIGAVRVSPFGLRYRISTPGTFIQQKTSKYRTYIE